MRWLTRLFCRTFVLVLSMCLLSIPTSAQEGSTSAPAVQASSEPPARTGAGLQFGMPTGFSVKSYINPHWAYTGSLVWDLGTFSFASAGIVHEQKFPDLPLNFFIGPGVMAGPGGFKDHHDVTMGLRGEFGLNFFLGPFEPYVALNPIITLNVATQGYIGGSFGMRYYL